jgi:predicted amidohydrolase YtcJ
MLPMLLRLLRTGLLPWLLVLLSACGADTNLVFINGQIITLDNQERTVTTLAVEAGLIAALGSAADVQPYIDRGFRVIDLEGKALIPGFIDAHSHFPGSGITRIAADLNSPPIGSVGTVTQLLDRLRERLDQTKPGRWIAGFGYDDTGLAEHRHPTRAELDAVSTEHPILITHISGHMAVANSLALTLAGIDAHTPDPEGGRIDRDPISGEPTGLLEETAMTLAQSRMPRPGLIESMRMTLAATEDYASQGVTTAQNGLTEPSYLDPLVLAARAGLLKQRLVIWPDETLGQEILEGRRAISNSNRITLGAVKLVADGSIQGYTAYLREPYWHAGQIDIEAVRRHAPLCRHGLLDPLQTKVFAQWQAATPIGHKSTDIQRDPTFRGYPRVPFETLQASVLRFHQAGYQLAIHGNGDAAIDLILDAIAHAQSQAPRTDTRHVLVHAQMLQPDQLERMAALGVTPSFFSLHTFYWGDRHRDIFLGPERAAQISPARSASLLNIPFTLHADTPVVPMNPLKMMQVAVHRQTSSGQVLGPAERITPLQALRALTKNAAWQLFLDEHRGTLEVGKAADLAVLSDNPLEQTEHIDGIEVLATYLGGQRVYKKK